MPKWLIKEDIVQYGTSYYTVCADTREEADKKYHNGEAEHDDTDWGGTDATGDYEIEKGDCDGCTDCAEPNPCPTCRYRIVDENGEPQWGENCCKEVEMVEDETCDYYEEGDPKQCPPCKYDTGNRCTHPKVDSGWEYPAPTCGCEKPPEEEQSDNDCVDCEHRDGKKCKHKSYDPSWHMTRDCYAYRRKEQAPPTPLDEIDQLLAECEALGAKPEGEPAAAEEDTTKRTCADCKHHTGTGTEDARCKQELHMIRGTYGASCFRFEN